MKLTQTHAYDDILNHSRPVSRRHLPMAREDRAAQFSPFAALTGYGDVIEEAARLTDRRIDLTEAEKQQRGNKPKGAHGQRNGKG